MLRPAALNDLRPAEQAEAANAARGKCVTPPA